MFRPTLGWRSVDESLVENFDMGSFKTHNQCTKSKIFKFQHVVEIHFDLGNYGIEIFDMHFDLTFYHYVACFNQP